jgi:uncharacterized membrane protein
MLTTFVTLISVTGYAVETVGVVIIILGSTWATIRMLREFSRELVEKQYQRYRRDLARAMLLGLEFLVAGDIIRTVVVANSISDVASLGLVVLIRTVLVFTIHLEIEGRWPWQPSPHSVETARENNRGNNP